mgnify:FL=1
MHDGLLPMLLKSTNGAKTFLKIYVLKLFKVWVSGTSRQLSAPNPPQFRVWELLKLSSQ